VPRPGLRVGGVSARAANLAVGGTVGSGTAPHRNDTVRECMHTRRDIPHSRRQAGVTLKRARYGHLLCSATLLEEELVMDDLRWRQWWAVELKRVASRRAASASERRPNPPGSCRGVVGVGVVGIEADRLPAGRLTWYCVHTYMSAPFPDAR
jgi:hypothetical protein